MKGKELIKESVVRLLDNTINPIKIKQITDKHEEKTHFIPVKYRVFGGLLQSLNIQFGNFIEVLMHKIIEKEKNLEIVGRISGKKNVPLSLNDETNALIDKFIVDRTSEGLKDLELKFEKLLKSIIVAQNLEKNFVMAKHDVDVLFRNKKDGVFYYVELKYNDDHDTGKFMDINRKFIKTYAGLVKELNIKETSQLKPILYYFNRKIMKGNIYVPEQKNIYRGEKLFTEFLSTNYDELDNYLTNISEDKEIIKIFDDLYNSIRFG
ncbi:MAG: restriction endonuclease [Elusimicrobia bacterium]|nr:restriction endonuclease [Elusimicrobiota bacterium]